MCRPIRVLRVAQEAGAIPYDIPGVEMSHVGELCSFDAFLKKYRLTDPALQQLAIIVRGADTDRLDLAAQSPGLLAISLGLSRNFKDDHELLRQGMVVYDALYNLVPIGPGGKAWLGAQALIGAKGPAYRGVRAIIASFMPDFPLECGTFRRSPDSLAPEIHASYGCFVQACFH